MQRLRSPAPAAPKVPMRDAILDATGRLLGRFGYQKMTMDDIAREAGIGRRTIYLHFPGKDEIVLATIDRLVEMVIRELRAIAASGESPVSRIRRMILARILIRFDAVQGHYQSLDGMLAVLRPAYLARRERYFEAEAAVLADALADGTRKGAFSTKEPLVAARTIVLATNSLLPYSLSTQELGERREIERKAARIADLLLDGLRR